MAQPATLGRSRERCSVELTRGSENETHRKHVNSSWDDERLEESPRSYSSSGRSCASVYSEQRSKENRPPNVDTFGIARGRCRCGRCQSFQRVGPKNLGCGTCACKSNQHRRINYFQKPPSLANKNSPRFKALAPTPPLENKVKPTKISAVNVHVPAQKPNQGLFETAQIKLTQEELHHIANSISENSLIKEKYGQSVHEVNKKTNNGKSNASPNKSEGSVNINDLKGSNHINSLPVFKKKTEISDIPESPPAKPQNKQTKSTKIHTSASLPEAKLPERKFPVHKVAPFQTNSLPESALSAIFPEKEGDISHNLSVQSPSQQSSSADALQKAEQNATVKGLQAPAEKHQKEEKKIFKEKEQKVTKQDLEEAKPKTSERESKFSIKQDLKGAKPKAVGKESESSSEEDLIKAKRNAVEKKSSTSKGQIAQEFSLDEQDSLRQHDKHSTANSKSNIAPPISEPARRSVTKKEAGKDKRFQVNRVGEASKAKKETHSSTNSEREDTSTTLPKPRPQPFSKEKENASQSNNDDSASHLSATKKDKTEQNELSEAHIELKKRIEAWRKRFQFALYNVEFQKCSDLCDEFLHEMKEETMEWRLPITIQRAQVYLKWSEGAESGKIRRSRIKCAKLDCAAVSEELLQSKFEPTHDALDGLVITMQAQIDLFNGHFSNAKRLLTKAIESMKKDTTLLVLWGLDFVTLAEKLTQEVSKASHLQTQAEDALRDHKPLRCLRHLDNLLQISPTAVRALSLKAEAFMGAKRWNDAVDYCNKVKISLDTGVDRRLCANLAITEAQCKFEMNNLDEAVDTLGKVDPIFLDGTIRARLKLWQRMQETKRRGNDAFKAGKYAEAIEHYNTGLTLSNTSKIYNAVLHSNRAASYICQKKYKLALNDCDAALRLDPHFTKALLRRARAGAQLQAVQYLSRSKVDYEKLFRKDASLQVSCKQEFAELNIKLDAAKLAEENARKARWEKMPSQSRPQSSASASNSSGVGGLNGGASTSSTGSKRSTTRGPSVSSRPSSAKPKSWKERQDDFFQEWYTKQKTSSGTSRPPYNGFKSSGKSSSHGRTSSTSSGSSRPRSAAGGSRTWGGGSFGSGNVTEWLDANGKVKNFYQILGLARQANVDRSAIKKAYHKLALQHHPDKTQDMPVLQRQQSETIFKRAAEAYAVLGKDDVREQYDRFYRCIG
mmetsp:Transcript_3120/g.7061  ORF Transcript_3120/g.7061 Transcript_3120/m.7061 type:complete len:1183 (+) Transcript_3120:79-3627(+)